METYDVPRGGVVVLYTDGVTEAEAPSGEHFGMGRLSKAVAAGCGETARGIHDGVRAAMKEFSGGCRARDDSTLVVLKGGMTDLPRLR
jgi:sigma-B regulation protein RsbU (phosphoserine phosphatase)